MAVLSDPQSSNLVVTDHKGTGYAATQLSCQNGLSALSKVEVDLLSLETDPSAWLGEVFSCELFQHPGSDRTALRTFKGVVTAVELLNTDNQRQPGFRIVMEPWLALLAFSSKRRVFQNMTTQAIVSEIFDELGFKGQYKVDSMPTAQREYCLQLNETDLAFVRRLLAEEGVHFYFGKDADSNTLILHDAAKPFDKSDKVTLDDASAPSGDYEVVTNWSPAFKFHNSSIQLGNYDYNQSKLVSSSAKSSKFKLAGNSKITESRYPVASITGQMDDLSSALVECYRAQRDTEYQLINGFSQNTDLCSGIYLKLAAHKDSAQLDDYLLVNVSYQVSVERNNSLSLHADFSCVPQGHAHYPQGFPKPQVQGLQSAVVAGKEDAEPACDEQGRIRIKFHWDEDAEGDKTSCWVRVAQAMAGSSYGCQFIPRAGQEVIVSFLNGDPDQPVVTASLFNSQNKPPYAQANTTQSGIKTQLKGESNELRFDDKADNEQLYLHAAKDMLVEVLNNAEEKVTAEKKVAVEKDISITGEANYSLTTKENITLESDTEYSLKAKDAISGTAKKIEFDADDTLELVVGSSKISMSSSKIELTSAEISISGDSKVSIKTAQLAAEGSASVDIKSSANVNLKAGAQLNAEGLMATLKGSVSAEVNGAAEAKLQASGMATVKGGIVMVN